MCAEVGKSFIDTAPYTANGYVRLSADSGILTKNLLLVHYIVKILHPHIIHEMLMLLRPKRFSKKISNIF
jgi:hypothetical protein